MNQNSQYHVSDKSGTGRLWTVLWKRAVPAFAAAALMVGLAGCSLDDLLMPIGGDIPFEQSQTTPPEMGAVDNATTVPDDASFGEPDDRPL